MKIIDEEIVESNLLHNQYLTLLIEIFDIYENKLALFVFNHFRMHKRFLRQRGLKTCHFHDSFVILMQNFQEKVTYFVL